MQSYSRNILRVERRRQAWRRFGNLVVVIILSVLLMLLMAVTAKAEPEPVPGCPACAHYSGVLATIKHDFANGAIRHLRPGISDELATELAEYAVYYSDIYDLDVVTVVALIFVESSFNPAAHNTVTDCRGLMQVRYLHAGKYDLNTYADFFDISKNMNAGCSILARYTAENDNDLHKGLRRYGTNVARVERYVDELSIWPWLSESERETYTVAKIQELTACLPCGD